MDGFRDATFSEIFRSEVSSSSTFEVINPATGDLLATLPMMGRAETERAVDRAKEAFEEGKLAFAPLEKRKEWLDRLIGELERHREDLARLITLEQGKPLAEARSEVDYGTGFFRFAAANLHVLRPRPTEEVIKGADWEVFYRPAGVVAIITPWNFPFAMAAKKISAALAAGCSVVAKPSELTPLTLIAVERLIEWAGFPSGVMNCVAGEASEIGKVFCTHPEVRLISFTGSTEVGRQLYAQSASGLKRLALELGGNAPFIVFEDADIEAAAEALVNNKFRCAGQTCVCANRVLLHASVEERFVEILVGKVARLRVGNGLEEGVHLGPLINREAFRKVQRLVAEAREEGATIRWGEVPREPAEEWGFFVSPLVLTGVTPNMSISREEIFGPVIAIASFKEEEEAVTAANATPYGLAAYLFTTVPERMERLGKRLRFGHVAVNSGMGPTAEIPFGGFKASGFGREGGEEGMCEYCDIQAMSFYRSL